MDSKTKHRILGVVVVVGLIVIMLPFFQSNRDISEKSATVQSPPFPDQTVHVATPLPAVDDMKQQPDDTINENKPAVTAPAAPVIDNPAADTKKIEPLEQPTEPTNESTTKEAEPTAAVTPPVTSNVAPVSTDTVTPPKSADKEEAAADTNHEPAPVATKKIVAKATYKSSKPKRLSHLRNTNDKNGLFKLQKSAWVVEVGSFKTKANALRVVNRLRANGYSAFIQQMATSAGNHTSVFVGPENGQASARALAEDIEKATSLRGIVISYKPLAG
jgi:DedD protein